MKFIVNGDRGSKVIYYSLSSYLLSKDYFLDVYLKYQRLMMRLKKKCKNGSK